MLKWIGNRLRKDGGKTAMENAPTLLSPWMIYVNRVMTLFADDDEVNIEYDDENVVLTLRVDNHNKADALFALMPSEKEFGNVTLKVNVVPCNNDEREEDMYRRAFEGNPVLNAVAEGYGPAGDVSYALFVPEIIQLKEDDISQFDGLTTLTYAELAKSVLDAGDVRISSAIL